MADYAATKALIEEALAPYQTELAELKAKTALLNSAIAKATAPHHATLEALKTEAEQLGLADQLGVFGEDACRLLSCGMVLKLTESEAVFCDDEKATIKQLLKEAGKAALLTPEEAAAIPGEPAKSEDGRMAASACVRIRYELNKAYIGSLYDDFAPWFNKHGIWMKPTATVTLSEAPPPVVKKPKAEKATKPKKDKGKGKTDQPAEVTADQPLIQEAA